MLKFNIKLIILVLSFNFLVIVKSDCTLNYPENIETVPRYEKHIGSFRLQIPYNGNRIQLRENEIISGYCDTQFRKMYMKVINFHSWEETYSLKAVTQNKASVTIKCYNDKLYYDGNSLSESTLECEQLSWSIYTTSESYSWCENNLNSTTLLLATKSAPKPYILAGICYNFEQLSLQTINYNVTYNTGNEMKLLMGISKSNLKSHQSLTEDLQSFKTTQISELSEEVLQQQLKELGKTIPWINLANYDVSPIVQGDSHANYFKEYENLLNIIWWHNLRMGNWKRFMNTLENYAFNNSFELYAGTSDVVRFPTDQKCEKNNLLEIKIGFKNETLPGYIWTYLKFNDNLNQDFVIVGYNSPYAEFFGLKNIIFCPDICSEIPWLNEISSSFRYTFAGIMFCCSTDFIKQTNHLNGFPIDVLLPRDLENNDEIEVTTEIEETTTDDIEETTEVELETESSFKLDNIIDTDSSELYQWNS